MALAHPVRSDEAKQPRLVAEGVDRADPVTSTRRQEEQRRERTSTEAGVQTRALFFASSDFSFSLPLLGSIDRPHRRLGCATCRL